MNQPNRRALVIDDDPGVRSYITELLIDEGFDVWSAADGAIGIAMIDEIRNLDLIVTDIIMPNKDGIEVLMNLRKTRDRVSPNAKVIAVSGGGPHLNPTSFLSDTKTLGADAILLKPFSLDNLRGTLASVGLTIHTLEPSETEARH